MRVKLLAVTSVVLLSPVCAALASSINQLVVFGDSLSDNGNAYIATAGAFPGPNYALYQFSNGLTTSFFTDGPNTSPVATGPQGLWVDQISHYLGVADPQPFLAGTGGTNYAIASAETGSSNPQDVGNQLLAFATQHPGGAPGNDLYTFWAGANDILDGKSPTGAADNIFSDILALASTGAKNFLWLNLPLLGDTPEGSADKAALNAASVAFNTEWSLDLTKLHGDGFNVIGVDIGKLFASVTGDPSAYGLSNVTDQANTSGAKTDAGYLFWDGLHPTTTGHEIIAETAYTDLTGVPEPASVSLAVFGLLALAGFGLKTRLRTGS